MKFQRIADPVEPSRSDHGTPAISPQAFHKVIRCPARFPLSTDEIYFGSSGRRSSVPYQL